MNTAQMLEVVAAYIHSGNRFLACQRGAGRSRAFEWEFVGGKVEPGETRAQALVRECREELGVTIAVERELTDVTHVYSDLSVHLTLFSAVVCDGEPRPLEHSDLRWLTLDEAQHYNFCQADRVFLDFLRKGQQGGAR